MLCNTYRLVADVASIVSVKSFTYRDAPEEWSNRYHFTGDSPADLAGWTTLAQALAALEKATFDSSCHVVRAYGYLSDTTDAVAVVDFTVSPLTPVAGTLSLSGEKCAGDAAGTIRWLTPDRTSKGKPIYLRKYLHAVQANTTDADAVAAAQLTAYGTFGTALLTSWGSTSATLCDKNGVVPTAPHASPWVTTRTLKRRGKRPPS